MAEAAESVTIECGYCLRKDGAMEDSRVLPCNHAYCSGCLDGYLKKYGTVRCPACSKVFDVKVDSLPSYKPGGDKYQCDVCVKKGKDIQPAVMYCKTCTKKHCDKHNESHDDLHEDHDTMIMMEYESQADRLETRNCTEHQDQVFSVGCGVCLSVYCVGCISPLNICTTGNPHELLNLGELVTRLNVDIDELKEMVISKEKELSALFKKTSKNVSEYEKETKEMIEKLHQTRDEQIEAIQKKYEKQEEEVVEARQMSQQDMTAFMEDVGKTLTTLSNQRMAIETRVRNNHQVDIVTTYRDTQTEMRQLTEKQLPELVLENVRGLGIRDERRDTEVEIVSTDNIYIDSKPELSVKHLPKSLTLLNSVPTGSFCHSVCHYKGNTYIGSQNCTLDVIGCNSAPKNLVPSTNECYPYSITVHEDKLYVLVIGSPNAVNVYDLCGQLITQWKHSITEHYTRHAIVSSQLVIPNRNKKQLIVYSLTGQVIKHIACPQLACSGSSICAVDKSSVAVTSLSKSLVCRLNITSDETLWECRAITHPQAVAMYGKDLVCVASEMKLSFLNVHTGDVVKEMAAGDISKGGHFMDIDICDDTLIASTLKGNIPKVLFYKLNQ